MELRARGRASSRVCGVTKTSVFLLLAIIFATCVAQTVRGRAPAVYNDSASYLVIDFSGNALRLWTVPLVYWPFTSNEGRVAAQTAVAVVSWLAAARAVASLVRSWLAKVVGFVGVLLIGLSPLTTVWHLAVLSESLAISLSMCLFAAAVAFVSKPTCVRVGVLAGATLVWAFTRHINLLVLAAALPVLVVLTVRHRQHRALMTFYVVALTVMVVWGGRSFFTTSYITTYNSAGLLFDRVLIDPEGPRLVREAGLEVPAELDTFAGNYAPNAPAILARDEVYGWVNANWTPFYLRWLIIEPEQTWIDPLRQAPHLLAGAVLYSPAPHVIPHSFANASADLTRVNLGVWLALPAAVASVAAPTWFRTKRRDAALLGFLFVAAVFAYYSVWWLSSTDLGRLMSPVAAFGRVLSVATLVLAGDTLAGPGRGVAPREVGRGR
jgi:hypothetical protein